MSSTTGAPVFDRVTVDPHVMGGQACIRGYRITVSLVVTLVANEMTIDEILGEYPDLEAEDVRQAWHYAAAVATEKGSGEWGSALAYLESARVNGPADWSDRWEDYLLDLNRQRSSTQQ